MKTLKMKDYVFLAIVSALYTIVYMGAMLISTPFGPFGHNISPGVFGLLGGSIIYYIAKKLGKMWQFSLLTLIVMGIIALMGGGYLPWLISSLVTAVIADLVISRRPNFSTLELALCFGLMQVGQAGGSLIPVLFFVDAYRDHWISRGQSPDLMDASIRSSQGILGLAVVIVVFTLSFIGIYLGRRILKRHFESQEKSKQGQA